jgi:hypothetical protein
MKKCFESGIHPGLKNRRMLKAFGLTAALSCLPLLQFFTLGYLYSVVQHYYRTGQLEVIPWQRAYAQSGALFKKGILLAALVLGFWGFPVLLSWALCLGIRPWFPQGLVYLSYTPVVLGSLLGPCIFAAALTQWLQWESWSKMGQLWAHIPRFIQYRSLLACGILSGLCYALCCTPLYGVAFFMLVSFTSYYLVSLLGLNRHIRPLRPQPRPPSTMLCP